MTPELLADFPQATFLDGMAAIPETGTLLITDPSLGVLWRINADSKAIDIVINNQYTNTNDSRGT